jgi:hypothetical protein
MAVIDVDKNDPLLGYPLMGRYANGKPNSIAAEHGVTRTPSCYSPPREMRYNFCRDIAFFARARCQ